MMAELLAFALVVFIGQFSPGPDLLLLTRTALVEGQKAGWRMVLGITSGLALHAILAIGGVAVISAQGGPALRMMTWLAAAYLLYLAMGLIRKDGGQVEGGLSKRSPYLRGLFCNLLNPKVFVFLASVVAPFLSDGRPGWWPYALWLLIVGEGLFFWGLWVRILQKPKIREWYHRMGRALDCLFAAVLTLLALRLIF